MRLFDIGARGTGPATVHDRIWTVANGITFVRLLGLPVFVWLVLEQRDYITALVVLITIGATDWIDGYVARRFDQVTRLGRYLDPLVDRLLLATSGITFVVAGIAPWLLIGLVVLRDAVLVGAVAVLFKGVPPLPVSRVGKFATACLLVGFPAFLPAAVDWPGADVLDVMAWLFTAVGAAAYYVAAFQYARAARVARRVRVRARR